MTGRNEISGEGAKYLSKSLITNQFLIQLILRDNNVANDGARVLGEGLQRNRTLDILDLSKSSLSIILRK